MCLRIKQSTKMEPDFLKKAGNKPPFEVPAGYFKQLHQRITEETRRDRNALRDEPIPVFPAAVSENPRSEEHTSELQSLMRTSDPDFCLKKNTTDNVTHTQ